MEPTRPPLRPPNSGLSFFCLTSNPEVYTLFMSVNPTTTSKPTTIFKQSSIDTLKVVHKCVHSRNLCNTTNRKNGVKYI